MPPTTPACNEQDLTPSQVVAVSIAHSYITEIQRQCGDAPSLVQTLEHVRHAYNKEAEEISRAIGSDIRTGSAIQVGVRLLALLVRMRM